MSSFLNCWQDQPTKKSGLIAIARRINPSNLVPIPMPKSDALYTGLSCTKMLKRLIIVGLKYFNLSNIIDCLEAFKVITIFLFSNSIELGYRTIITFLASHCLNFRIKIMRC